MTRYAATEGFRSRNAPASLKDDRHRFLAVFPLLFPEQKCSGFIEGRNPPDRSAHPNRFRSRNAPASLKGLAGARPGRRPDEFPEQKCSGFIEGAKTVVSMGVLLLVSGAEMLRLH